MSKKHFHAENAARGLIGGVKFEIYDTAGGSAFGIFTTEDKDVLALLEKEAANPKSAVTVISQEEYEFCHKKKQSRPDSGSYPALRQPLPTPLPITPRGAGPVIIIENPQPTPDEQKPIDVPAAPIETLEDALQTGPVVMAPQGESVEQPKSRGKNKK